MKARFFRAFFVGMMWYQLSVLSIQFFATSHKPRVASFLLSVISSQFAEVQFLGDNSAISQFSHSAIWQCLWRNKSSMISMISMSSMSSMSSIPRRSNLAMPLWHNSAIQTVQQFSNSAVQQFCSSAIQQLSSSA
ncbi:MAG TPA: hypothetical protein PLY70_16380, partial [Saprospiraceae bacterium]|nr:hypothetical protein [Saprospiraceae bacterium]